MDLLTLAELFALTKMLADLVASCDHMSEVIERHIARRMHPGSVSTVSAPTDI